MAISLIQYQACHLLFELRGKRTSLLAHQTPLHGEHSRLNQCLGTLNHYTIRLRQPRAPASAPYCGTGGYDILARHLPDALDEIEDFSRWWWSCHHKQHNLVLESARLKQKIAVAAQLTLTACCVSRFNSQLEVDVNANVTMCAFFCLAIRYALVPLSAKG